MERGSRRRDAREADSGSRLDSRGATSGMSAFVPMLLLAVTILVMVGFQTLQLAKERDALSARQSALASPLQEVTTVRQPMRLSHIAVVTARTPSESMSATCAF